jgi:GntR family transcriptional regulator
MSTPPTRYTARQIATELRAEIVRGTYRPGQQLPRHRELMARFDVAKQTVQKALDLIRDEGLVVGRIGSGVFVRDAEPFVRIPRRRFVFRDELGYYFDETAQGYKPVETPTVDVVPAHAEIARRLGVDIASPVVKRFRVLGELEPEPRGLQVAVSYLPAWLHDELPVVGEPDTGLGGIYDRIEEHFGQPLSWEEAQGAVAASLEEATVLHGVAHGGPLVRILRTATLPDGRAVEVNDTRMDGGRYEVVAVLDRDESAVYPPAPAVKPISDGK